MAAKLKKPIVRDVGDIGLRGGDRGEYVVTLYPHGVLGLRRKRSRQTYMVSLAACYALAARAVAEERRRDAAQKRKLRTEKRRRRG